MSNIIKFPESESFSYIETDNKVLGVMSRGTCSDIELMVDGDNIEIHVGDIYTERSRKEMAQFLWAAAYFIDSNQEWAEGEYPALNE